MGINERVKEMVNDFSKLEEVQAILLAGSQATNTQDENSDYDIYIYVSKEIPVEKRKIISDKFCSYMELNNTFWETEDDGILRDGDIPVEIIYRDINWIASMLDRTLIQCQADVGYTTCFWANLINSIVLYDKNGDLGKLQEKFNISYPKELKKNIVKKNYPLLKQLTPAYYYQIEKAIKRDDFISVNHRVAAFFASYFDIIFAINEMPHPGEKKILKIIKDKDLKVPDNMENNVKNILNYSANSDIKILLEIDLLIEELDILLEKQGISK